ncbi:nucleoside hydrolase [Sulfobacillus sp. hq2]|nr:nucleoside hydrolase [Sulfobacillus sp. hq2]
MAAVYLDMDPGHDDALAMLVALATLEVQGVSVVAGNQTVDKTMRNARRILTAANRPDIPLREGASRPLFRSLVTAGSVHGTSGLDGYEFPVLDVSESAQPAVAWLREQMQGSLQAVTWIATGPLTNVASFILGHPDLVKNIGLLAIMGGALRGGNITPCAEFNFYVDPDAANIVLTSGIPIRLVGLDVTHKALLSQDGIQRFRRLPGMVGEMLYGLFTFFAAHEPDANAQGVPIHDVLAVAAAEHPEFFTWLMVPVTVERCDGQCRGQVQQRSEGPLVAVATDIDTAKFFDWMWTALERYYR